MFHISIAGALVGLLVMVVSAGYLAASRQSRRIGGIALAILPLVLLLAGSAAVGTSAASPDYRPAATEPVVHGMGNSSVVSGHGLLPSRGPLAAASAAVSSSHTDQSSAIVTNDRLEQLAGQLDDDPSQIFNWVRANVTFEPGWGSVLGAEGCRQTLTCNAHDTASLLIAVLDAAGVDARYVSGVVEVEARLFRSVVGEMETLDAASKAAVNTGWPHEVVAKGRRVRLAHVWVEAPLGSGGGTTSSYVPLDAALKRHRFIRPDRLPRDAEALIRGLGATVSYDAQQAVVDGFDGTTFDAQAAAATDAVFERLERGEPGSRSWMRRLGGILGGLAPDVRPLRVTSGSRGDDGDDGDDDEDEASAKTGPPGQIVEVAARDEVLPDTSRHRVEIRFPGAGGQPGTSLYLDELTGERLTVDFGAADQAAIDAVAAAGGPWAVAPRSILMHPVLLAGGVPVLTGMPIRLTDFQAVHTRVVRPDGVVASEAVNFLRAGGVGALVLDPVRMGAGTVEVVRERIEALADRVAGAPVTLSFDEFHGEWLAAHGVAYFTIVDIATELAAHRLDVREVAAVPGIAMVSWQPVPQGGAITTGALQIDAQQLGMAGGVARDGEAARAALHRQAAGAFSSGMEHGIFESLLRVDATSTVDVLRRELDADRPVGVILDDASRATVFAKLNAPSNVRDFMANSVANGFDVYTPLSPTTIDDWTGTGWMQLREDGAFGFLLAGAISGGSTTDDDNDVRDAMYSAAVEGGLEAAGQAANFSVSTGAKAAAFVLAPIGAGMETYDTIKDMQAAGASTGQAVATGIGTGLIKGALGIATGVAASAAAASGGGPPAFIAVAAYGEYHAEQATEAIKNHALCGQLTCP